MKTRPALHFMALLGAAMSLSQAAAFAQETGKPDGRPDSARPRPGQNPRGNMPRPGVPRPGMPGPGMPGPEMMERGLAMLAKSMPLMKALDLDEDGQISAIEIENANKSLMKLDMNGDGLLSPDELRPEPGTLPNGFGAGGGPEGRPGPGNPAMLMRMFETRDADGDGKLSGDEIPPPLKERMANIDENGDGDIEKSEVEKAMRRFEERTGNRPERSGNAGGQGVPPRRPPNGNRPGNGKPDRSESNNEKIKGDQKP